MTDKLFIGVDVSKGWLDIARCGDGKIDRIDNTPEAVAAFLAQLDPRPALVAFESTGGYERTLRAGLLAAGIAFARAHPNEVAAFRTRRGIKAKTDRIDARQLADFAAMELATRGLAPMVEGDETLRELAVRRRQLVDALQAERCRTGVATSEIVRNSLKTLIETLAKAVDDMDAEIDAHIKKKRRSR